MICFHFENSMIIIIKQKHCQPLLIFPAISFHCLRPEYFRLKMLMKYSHRWHMPIDLVCEIKTGIWWHPNNRMLNYATLLISCGFANRADDRDQLAQFHDNSNGPKANIYISFRAGFLGFVSHFSTKFFLLHSNFSLSAHCLRFHFISFFSFSAHFSLVFLPSNFQYVNG